MEFEVTFGSVDFYTLAYKNQNRTDSAGSPINPATIGGGDYVYDMMIKGKADEVPVVSTALEFFIDDSIDDQVITPMPVNIKHKLRNENIPMIRNSFKTHGLGYTDSTLSELMTFNYTDSKKSWIFDIERDKIIRENNTFYNLLGDENAPQNDVIPYSITSDGSIALDVSQYNANYTPKLQGELSPENPYPFGMDALVQQSNHGFGITCKYTVLVHNTSSTVRRFMYHVNSTGNNYIYAKRQGDSEPLTSFVKWDVRTLDGLFMTGINATIPPYTSQTFEIETYLVTGGNAFIDNVFELYPLSYGDDYIGNLAN
jgi:hypothetical protein